MKQIKRCPKCCAYTLHKKCKECGSVTKTAHPPKFSPTDRYGKYRRMAIQSKQIRTA